MEAITLFDLPNGKIFDSFKIQIVPTLPHYYEVKDGDFVIAGIHFKVNETKIISNDDIKIISNDEWEMILNKIDEVICSHLFEDKNLFKEV